MDNQNERIGSLMAFSDIALIISTYGVLLAFNFLVEPIGSNTWIVCTFFVGIKVLIVGIADLTGIGKSIGVSAIFVLVADGIIFLINQLMAFGISMRMLLIMAIVDVIFVIIAVLLWKHFAGSNATVVNEPSSWREDEESPTTVEIPETSKEANSNEVLTELAGANTGITIDEEAFSFDDLASDDFSNTLDNLDDQEEVFSFTTMGVDQTSPEQTQRAQEIVEEESQTDENAFLSFEEITQELPSDEEIQNELNLEKDLDYIEEEEPQESLEISEESLPEEEQIETETDEAILLTKESEENEPSVFEEEPLESEPISLEKPEEKESEAVTEFETEEKPEEIETVTEEEPITEETSTEEAELETVEEPVEEELPELESVIDTQEETLEEAPLETVQEQEEVEETVEPEEEVSEEETFEETEPLDNEEFKELTQEIPRQKIGVINMDRFLSIAGGVPELETVFQPLSIDIGQQEIDEQNKIVKKELVTLNNKLDKLINLYNESEEGYKDQIDLKEPVTEETSIQSDDAVIRSKLKDLIQKQFIKENVLRALIGTINKIQNRAYTISVAERKYKDRIALEKERKEEEERKKREAELKAQEAQRKEAEERAKQEKAKQEKKKTETQSSDSENEIHLKNDDMDIIIDKADLALLKEFLKQQETNK